MKFDFNFDYKVDEVKDIMKLMKYAPLLTYPFMFSQPAFAAEKSDFFSKGFFDVESELLTDFAKEVQESGFDVFQQFVNVMKLIVQAFDQGYENLMGYEAGGFGLSLIAFTVFVKLLIFPFYEGQLRSTAAMQKV